MSVILLMIPVILSTLIWPINRKVMMDGGRTDAYGFWISLSGAATSGVLALAFKQSYRDPVIWLIGLVIGFAFSVGFCLIINYCLKIGPTGPTVALNNMGLVGPVIAGLIWPFSRPFTLPVGFGLFLVILAMVGFSARTASSTSGAQAVTLRWLVLVLLGWLLAVVSMTGQYVGSVLLPGQPLAMVSVFFLWSTVILMPFVMRRGKTWFQKNEMTGGFANGAIQAVSIYVTLLALRRMGTQIVFPVTVLVPMMLVLVLSGFVYKEHLERLTWIACLVGLAGLALLSMAK